MKEVRKRLQFGLSNGEPGILRFLRGRINNPEVFVRVFFRNNNFDDRFRLATDLEVKLHLSRLIFR